MTNSKNTKRALLASTLSVVLCTAMFVGSTFAWFTDSAATGVNKIQAGNLKIALETKDGNEWKDVGEGPLAFVQLNGATEDILWEPGCTYKLPELRIANKGNLALKFKLLVNGLSGTADEEAVVADLAEVIDVYTGTTKDDVKAENKIGTLRELMNDPDGAARGVILPEGETVSSGSDENVGATAGYTLLFHMQEGAGNKYQDMNLDGISFTVVATQYTYENDSFDNKYDEAAEYPEVKAPVTAEGFKEALAGLEEKGDKNVVIHVTQDVEEITGIKTAGGNSLAVDFGGNTVTVAEPVGSKGTETLGMQLLQGSNVVLQNGTYKPANEQVKMLVQNYSDLTLKDVTLDASQFATCQYVLSNNCGYIVITGDTNIIAASGNVAFDSCKFGSYPIPTVVFDENMTGEVDGKIEMTGGNLIIKGGTFKNSGMDFETFKGYVADGFEATNSDGVYTVAKAN